MGMTNDREPRSQGFTLTELLMAVALISTLAGIALPMTNDVVDELRTAAAARYLAGQFCQREALRAWFAIVCHTHGRGLNVSAPAASKV